MKSQKGFSLVSTVVAVAIVGVLASIATPVYQLRVAKAQTMEAFSSMEAMKVQVAANLTKSGKCTLSGGNETSNHKYGVLTVSGSANATSLANPTTQLDTGCDLKYTFNSNGASKLLAGKVIQADVFNNMVLSKSSSTNLVNNLLPKPFTALTADSVPSSSVKNETPYVAKDTTAITEPVAPSGGIEGDEEENWIPYAYSFRFQPQHMGQIPLIQVSCVFQTKNPGTGKLATNAWMYLIGGAENAGQALKEIASPSGKALAKTKCNDFGVKMGKGINGAPNISYSSMGSEYVRF